MYTCVLGEPDGTFPGWSELGEIDGDIEVEMVGDKALGLSEVWGGVEGEGGSSEIWQYTAVEEGEELVTEEAEE